MQKAMQACGSLRPSGGPGGGGGGGVDSSAMQAFQSCMKDNGAAIAANAGLRDLKTTDPAVAKALEKCRALMPARGGGGQSTPAT